MMLLKTAHLGDTCLYRAWLAGNVKIYGEGKFVVL